MLAVRGSDWPHQARVTFTLELGPMTFGLELRSTRAGTFEVGAKHVDFCHGSRFWARDMAGHVAFGPIGDPYCPPNAYTSSLVVLQGALIRPRVTTIYGSSHGKIIVIKRGDSIHLWESGKSSPKLMPSAPDKYFSLIGHGWLPVACAAVGPGCTAGFYWQWIGMRLGKTNIVLQPWCGDHACPQNYLIDIPIVIERRSSG